jgi:hypothetical protein
MELRTRSGGNDRQGVAIDIGGCGAPLIANAITNTKHSMDAKRTPVPSSLLPVPGSRYGIAYCRGSDAAVAYLSLLGCHRSTVLSRPPNDLAFVFRDLVLRMLPSNALDAMTQPVQQRTAEQEDMIGEYCGFCATLMAALH